MFTIAWWYLLGTLILILTGLLVSHTAFFWAIALCLAQAVHFGIEDKNFLSFTCQVRYAMIAMLAAGLWEPLSWIYWVMVCGLTARLTVNYCMLARIMALMPWNRKQAFSEELCKRAIFLPPTKGKIQF